MEKVTFAIAGMGNRGTKYAQKQFENPDDMQVVAMADRRPIRLEAANKYLNLPAERIFSSVEEMLEAPRLADVMIIATQDAQHKGHAIAALEKGYDLILEKPIANHLQDVFDIQEKANALGRRVLVCHVLRYTPFYRTIKKLLTEGRIGKIESIEANEAVGYYHIAHSFVRGNWHKLADSAPMILAKCCHDMDLFLWLTGAKCEKVTSFGSLDYFKKENCPADAADRCEDCKRTCPFNAVNFYLSRIPGWPANVLNPEPDEKNIMEALRTTDYGRCVFKMDNDVVDHQVVNMLFTGGITASFQMNGFNAVGDRWIRIFGTEGEIYGKLHENKVHLVRFNEPEEVIDLSEEMKKMSGHAGGDSGLIRDAIKYFRNEEFDRTSITELNESVDSHTLCFAAERSRLDGGRLVELKDFHKE